MIATDTGHERLDEGMIDVDNRQLLDVVSAGQNIVIHCPGMAHVIHEYDGGDVAIVFMLRPIEEIVASQERINWKWEDNERSKYGEGEAGLVSVVKYKHWFTWQRDKITNPAEICYHSLNRHPLWVDKEHRTDWIANRMSTEDG
jgi:hypothetical protein